MPQSTPPKVIKVEVIATRPTAADSAAIAHLSDRDRKSLPEVAYLIKLHFETMPPVTSHGWALYVNDFRIPKYWQHKEGIYFKVFDPDFLRDHRGQSLRFSHDGVEFNDTGHKLPPLPVSAQAAAKELSELPSQDDVLK